MISRKWLMAMTSDELLSYYEFVLMSYCDALHNARNTESLEAEMRIVSTEIIVRLEHIED